MRLRITSPRSRPIREAMPPQRTLVTRSPKPWMLKLLKPKRGRSWQIGPWSRPGFRSNACGWPAEALETAIKDKLASRANEVRMLRIRSAERSWKWSWTWLGLSVRCDSDLGCGLVQVGKLGLVGCPDGNRRNAMAVPAFVDDPLRNSPQVLDFQPDTVREARLARVARRDQADIFLISAISR